MCRRRQNFFIFALVFCSMFLFGKELMCGKVDDSFGDFELEEGKELIFYVPFDGSSMAKIAAGDSEPIVDHIEEYVEGRNNRKAVVANKENWVKYEAQNNINASSGTITMWIKCLEWSGDDKYSKYFFTARGKHEPEKDGWLVIYKLYQNLMIAASRRSGGEAKISPIVAARNISDWKQGEWHFIGLTWSAENIVLYVDGKLPVKRTLKVVNRPKAFYEMSVGGFHPWVKGGEMVKSALQDLCIFNRPLTENEMKEIYKAVGDKDKEAQVKQQIQKISKAEIETTKVKSKNMKVTYSYRKDDPMMVRVDLSKCKKNSGPLKIQLYDGDWTEKYLKIIDLPESKRYIEKIDISKFPKRDYYITVSLYNKKGEAEECFQESFRIPDENKWLGNTIGISDKVPSPWTAMQVKNNTVYCWGREYYLGEKGSLLDKIVIRGKQILYKPISFEIKLKNRIVKIVNQRGDILKKSEIEVIYNTYLQYDGFSVNHKYTIEYDGMIRVDTMIKAEKNIVIDSMKIRIPLKKEYATLFNISAARGNSKYLAGVVREDGWHGAFHPLVWLGDEDRGLLWFAEWMKDWAVEDEDNMMRIIPGEDSTDIVITMIDCRKEFKKGKPITYTFGIQASPVKPMPKDWRTWDVVSWEDIKDAESKIEKENLSLHRPGPDSGAYPEPFHHGSVLDHRDEQKYRKELRYSKSLGIKEYIYTLLDNVSGVRPEYRYYFEEWYNGSKNPRWTTIKNEGMDSRYKSLQKINCDAQSFIDYKVWVLAEGIKRFDFDGYYYDLIMPYPTWNVNSNCLYLNHNGKWRGKHSIFSRREIAKRVYVFLREHKNQGQTYIMGHDSGNNIFLPVNAFCDISYNGEQYCCFIRKKIPYDFDYSKFLDLGQVRAHHTYRQIGLVPLILPEIRNIPEGDKNFPGMDRYTKIFYSYFGINDINIDWRLQIWRWFLDIKVAKVYEDIKREFDMRDEGLEFIPYWNDQDMFKVRGEVYDKWVERDREGVSMSIYLRKKEKRALLMISNLDKEEKDKEIWLNLEKMGFSGQVIGIDQDGTELLVDDSKINVKLEPQSLRVVRIQCVK